MSSPTSDDRDFLGTGHHQRLDEPLSKRQDNGTLSNRPSSDDQGERFRRETDPYCGAIKRILESSETDGKVKFEKLFTTRFGIRSQLGSDRKLLSALNEDDRELTERDWMYLTLKHFNQYGGFPVD